MNHAVEHDSEAGSTAIDEPRQDTVDARLKLDEAHALARLGNLRILTRRGVYQVYRNTVPKLTFIGEAVDSTKLLLIVRRAAGSRKASPPGKGNP